MSKDKENNALPNNQGDPVPDRNKDKSGLLTIEEHAKNMNIGAPVFTAVMESNKWAIGKRVSTVAFEKAVKDFLGAPIGGITSKGGA